MDIFMVTPFRDLSIIISQAFWVTISCVSSYQFLTDFIINLEVYFVLQWLYMHMQCFSRSSHICHLRPGQEAVSPSCSLTLSWITVGSVPYSHLFIWFFLSGKFQFSPCWCWQRLILVLFVFLCSKPQWHALLGGLQDWPRFMKNIQGAI